MFWKNCQIPVLSWYLHYSRLYLSGGRGAWSTRYPWNEYSICRLLDLVEPKFGKVKKNYSKFQGRITKPQLTWKQRADVVYFHLHLFLGIETLSSCLECSKCNYPNFCSAPSNFVRWLNLRFTNSAQARFRCYALAHSFCILLYHYFIMSTFVRQLLQKPPGPLPQCD